MPFRSHDKAQPIAHMEAIQGKVTNFRRNLPGVAEEAEIEVTPDSIAVFEAGRQGAVVCKPAVLEPSKSRLASYGRKIEEWDNASTFLRVGFDTASDSENLSMVVCQREKLLNVCAVVPI
jgi:hypothetical protein